MTDEVSADVAVEVTKIVLMDVAVADAVKVEVAKAVLVMVDVEVACNELTTPWRGLLKHLLLWQCS